jgi:hypothetical protein
MAGRLSVIESAAARAGLAAFLVGFLALPATSPAQPREVKATVIWVRGDRVYIAAPDSTALEQGDLLTFEYRGQRIASGEVARVHDGELALAKLTSGSLKKAKKLDRLRILGERPRLPALPLLRVGYPAERRSNLIFACAESRVISPLPPTIYRRDALAGDSFRLVRDPESSNQPPWPDTLLIRLFDEVADEEIALERGELDVAVFWPGELATHLREDPRWPADISGLRTRGIIAAMWLGPRSPNDSSAGALPDSLDLALLTQEAFRGDLVPWRQVAGWAATPDSPPGSRRLETVRYAVDPSWPGQRVLERILNRGTEPQAIRDDAQAVRLFYIHSPIAAPESLALGVADHVRTGAFTPEVRARADSLAGEIRRLPTAREPVSPRWLGQSLRDLHVTLLFAIRCPLICAPRIRPYVKTLGTEAFVNLLDCLPADHRP